MERKLATVRQIAAIEAIKDADAIEKARIGGWWVVVKKGEFKAGDKCVYFEIDSLLPPKEPFTFLEKNGRKTVLINGEEFEGYRLRTIKLRGQISQGLALPIGVFPGIDTTIGADVTDFIGVVKFEAPIPAQFAGSMKGGFPSFIRKTDEERVQNLPDFFNDYKDDTMYVTEKLDGTSVTFYKYDDEFGVCSRNVNLQESDTNLYWSMAKKYNLAENLPNGFAVQGEIVGESVSGNRLKMSGRDCYVFHVQDIANGEYLSPDEIREFVKKLGMKTVPVIYTDLPVASLTIDKALAMAEMKSVLNSKVEAEGLVFRLNGVREKIGFKAVSNKYLMKHGD